jgi:hypothetical protein
LFFWVTLICALAAIVAAQETAIRSESFIVRKIDNPALPLHSALTVCQGLTTA